MPIKRQPKRTQIKEIVFDDDARREFLTGFHKRKVAKADAARKNAAEREKRQHKEALREQRQALREQAAKTAEEVEAAYGALVEGHGEFEEEWQGISPNPPHEQEYEDEETLATVAIVEDFDPDALLHGPIEKNMELQPRPAHPTSSAKTTTSTQPRKSTKRAKIKYQTKGARKAEQKNQRARKLEKAELAGGRASRKKDPGKRKR